MDVRVRVGPSPTGNPHIGTAFTALFNWLFARKHGGQFFLRIEDTDKQRSKKEYEAGIFEGIHWLGLDWDNKEIIRQSERTDIYKKYLQQLLNSGKAYWRKYTSEEKIEIEKDGRSPRDEVIVLKDEDDPERNIGFDDVIHGRISVQAKNIGQLVIAKSLDEPLYHFAVVVDDIDMGITHVLRGEEHISNTPKHLLIYEAIGATPPKFAHLPLMLGADRSKLSKRNGDVDLSKYKNDYLPEALLNFLASLSYTFDSEVLSLDEMIDQFDLERTHKTGAIFDVKKLNWMNAQYARKLSPEHLREIIGIQEIPDAAVPLITERLEKLSDAASFSYLWEKPEYEPSLLNWKDMPTDKTIQALTAVRAILADIKIFDAPAIRSELDELAKDFGGRGAVYWPFRVALSGQKASPDPADIAVVLGCEETLSRIDSAIEKISHG